MFPYLNLDFFSIFAGFQSPLSDTRKCTKNREMETQPKPLYVIISLCQPFCQVCLCTPRYLKGELHWTHSLNKLHPIHYLFFFLNVLWRKAISLMYLFISSCLTVGQKASPSVRPLFCPLLAPIHSHTFPLVTPGAKKPWLALQVESEKKRSGWKKALRQTFSQFWVKPQPPAWCF